MHQAQVPGMTHQLDPVRSEAFPQAQDSREGEDEVAQGPLVDNEDPASVYAVQPLSGHNPSFCLKTPLYGKNYR
jgi:hypothetical protein